MLYYSYSMDSLLLMIFYILSLMSIYVLHKVLVAYLRSAKQISILH